MARRARRWCNTCGGIVPSQRHLGGKWTCEVCADQTLPVWMAKAAQSFGAARARRKAEKQGQSSTPAQATAFPAAGYCPSCGTAVTATDAFCRSCGAKLN